MKKLFLLFFITLSTLQASTTTHPCNEALSKFSTLYYNGVKAMHKNNNKLAIQSFKISIELSSKALEACEEYNMSDSIYNYMQSAELKLMEIEM